MVDIVESTVRFIHPRESLIIYRTESSEQRRWIYFVLKPNCALSVVHRRAKNLLPDKDNYLSFSNNKV